MPLSERERELHRLLIEYLEYLHEYQALDATTLRPFGPEDAAVQRWLQLAIQCCIDLGDILLGRLGEDEPPRSRDIFAALTRRAIIRAPLAQQMEELTGFRNALAHAYADLAPVATWQQLRTGLPALAEFAERMSEQ
jgi:uncharacterized protein YutE (UPF0331/DUF86 family)